MRVLIFHGYLLRGTGSNIYNANLARALVADGHEVHLLCQEPAAEQLSFIDAVGSWSDGDLTLRTLREPIRCTAYRPDIGELLPVYVDDTYEGFTAKAFRDCSDDELAAYVQANVAAVGDVGARVSPDVALANHAVMGPLILARALDDTVPYAVKIHGSAMEYTVRPQPERFLPALHEGLARARGCWSAPVTSPSVCGRSQARCATGPGWVPRAWTSRRSGPARPTRPRRTCGCSPSS